MILTYASIAISLIVAGIVIGVMCIVCLGIHREERDHSVTDDTTISAIRGTRRLTGLSARGYSRTHEPVRRNQ